MQRTCPESPKKKSRSQLLGKCNDCYSNFDGASDKAKMFVAPFERLAFAPREDLRKEWTIIDYNGNGQVSLAELDTYIQKKLKLQYPNDKDDRLWKGFRPSYVRAYTDAKDIGENKKITGTRSLTTDDYIEPKEFRATLHYVCLYALMYDKFALVDGYGHGGEAGELKKAKPGTLKAHEYDDRRIDKREWMAGYQAVSDSGFVGLQCIQDPEAMFNEIDENRGGFILLNEWCQYIEKKEADAGTGFGDILTLGE